MHITKPESKTKKKDGSESEMFCGTSQKVADYSLSGLMGVIGLQLTSKLLNSILNRRGGEDLPMTVF
jgi:hypothetical protein